MQAQPSASNVVDLLPWDVDCDLAVWEEDVHKIAEGDLDSQYRVHNKSLFIAKAVTDKTTGFYCDIFSMKYNSDTQQVEMPWPWGTETCPEQSLPFEGQTCKKCWKHPYHTVAPFATCTFNGVQHTCMKNQLAFLNVMYASNVAMPDVDTALAQRST